MAIIKKNDLKQMNEVQLTERLEELRKELMQIRTQISTGTNPENPGRVRELKKTIAKLLTMLTIVKKQPKAEKKKAEKKTEKKTEKKSEKKEEKKKIPKTKEGKSKKQ